MDSFLCPIEASARRIPSGEDASHWLHCSEAAIIPITDFPLHRDRDADTGLDTLVVFISLGYVQQAKVYGQLDVGMP